MRRIEYATGRPSASPIENVGWPTEEMHLPDVEVERPRRIGAPLRSPTKMRRWRLCLARGQRC
jgi:hypothetical protein